MIVPSRAGVWLAALGLLVMNAGVRAAVMTANIQVASGSATHAIGYVLAQDVTSMTVKIHKSSDSSVLRTFTVTAPAALTKGTHTTDVSWDGKDDAAATAPIGTYYAEIVTQGAATTAMTLLSGPTPFAHPSTTGIGRNLYGGSAGKVPTLPNHNLGYFGSDPVTTGGQTSFSGAIVVYPDATGSYLQEDGASGTNDYLAASVETDGSILLSGQGTLKWRNINPDGSLIADYPSGNFIRGQAVVGTGATADAYFVDGSLGGISLESPIGSAPVTVVLNANIILPYQSTQPAPAPQRSIAMNAAGTVMYVGGDFFSAATSFGVARFTKDGFGNWNEDTAFSTTIATENILPQGTYRGIKLSPDESILWVDCGSSGTVANRKVLGFDAVTGASKGANYIYSFGTGTQIPLGLAVAQSGDLYVALSTSTGTPTTSTSVAVLAPPDNGSYIDSTVSTAFQVVADTNIHVLTGPTATVNSFHDATIEWTTSIASNSIVKIGTSAGNLSQTITQNESVTTHTVNVTGLIPTTTYYFQIQSAAPNFTTVTAPSTPANFTTQSLAVNDVLVSGVTESNATVAWTTDQNATTYVDFGMTAGGPYPVRYTRYHSNDTLGTTHTILLVGLKPGTTYYLKAESGAGTTTTSSVFSAEQTFTTLPYVNITSETLAATTTTATLNYTTDIASSATVNWGTSAGSLSNSITVPSGTNHAVNFTSLSPGTTYYYAITLSAPSATDRVTRTSSLVTAASSSATATVSDTTPDKFDVAMRSQVALASAGSLLTLEKQSVPGPTALSTNKVPYASRYAGWAQSRGFVYAIGGFDGTVAHADVHFAPINPDGTIGAFTATASMPDVRYVITGQCFGYNGFIYVLGGEISDGTTQPTVFYAKQNADGTLQAWQTSANAFPEERDLYGGHFYEGNIVYSGGENNAGTDMATNYVASIKPDGSIGPIVATTPLAEEKYLQPQVYNNHTLYSIGGVDDFPIGEDIIQFSDTIKINPNGDFSTMTRDALDPGHVYSIFDQPHYGMGAALTGGKIVTVAGRLDSDASTPHSLISHTKLAADGSTTAWVTDAADGSANAYPTAERDTDAVAYNGNIYVINARNSNVYNDTPGWVKMVADPNDSGYAFSGTVDGRFIDLGAVANLAHLTVSGTGVTGSSVEVRYRFANTDGDWTDWYTLNGVDADISGGAQFFQYELVLKASGTNGNAVSPVVNSISLYTGTFAQPLNRDDAAKALRIAGGLITATQDDKTRLNVAGADGVIDIQDAVKIWRTVNGK